MKKWLLPIGVCVLGILIICFTTDREAVTKVERPDYRGDNYTEELLMVEANGEHPIAVDVMAKEIPANELPLAFDETFDEVCRMIKGKNPSLDEVREDLNFTNHPGRFGMKADYSLKDYSIISAWGSVSNQNLSSPFSTEIHVSLRYKKMLQEYDIPVTVLPPALSEQEKLVQSVQKELQEQGGEADLILPNMVDGKKVSFYRETGTRRNLLLCLIVGTVAFWYEQKFILPQKKRDKREELLKADYAEIVSKLSLLVGSGMSTRNALIKMSQDYTKRQKTSANQDARRPAYEELGVMVRRIESGVSEAQAYRDYGRVCKLHSYMRLGELLGQSVRKGNTELLDQLRDEATDAFEERKAYALRAGEKASTKLVLPMIMMLAIVFIIIIVPAFMTMG